jgi:hypothetical protein
VDELEFQQQFVPDGPVPLNVVLARHAAPDLLELEEAAADRAAEAERQERLEARVFLNRARGDPLGNLSRATSAVSAARDRVADLEAQLESARAVLSRAQSNMAEWGRAADEVLMSPRVITEDLAAGAKRALAEAKVERMLSRAAAESARYPKECSGPGCEVCSAGREADRVRGKQPVVRDDPDAGREIVRTYGNAIVGVW